MNDVKNTLKAKAGWIAAVMIGVLGLAVVVRAQVPDLSFKELLARYVGDKVAESYQNAEEPNLGAVVSPFALGDLTCSNGFCTQVIQREFTASTTGKTQLALLANFYPTYRTRPTSTLTDVVVETLRSGYGLTISTTTVSDVFVTIGNTSSGAPTSTFEVDCSASDVIYTTSTPQLINTEAAIPANVGGVVMMGTASTTNTDFGSLIIANGERVLKGVVTPKKPYLNCVAFSPTGAQMDTFNNSANGAKGTVTAVFKWQQ